MTAVSFVPLALALTRGDRMPLNHTVAPVRWCPVIVMVAPCIPEAGAIRLMVGAATSGLAHAEQAIIKTIAGRASQAMPRLTMDASSQSRQSLNGNATPMDSYIA